MKYDLLDKRLSLVLTACRNSHLRDGLPFLNRFNPLIVKQYYEDDKEQCRQCHENKEPIYFICMFDVKKYFAFEN